MRPANGGIMGKRHATICKWLHSSSQKLCFFKYNDLNEGNLGILKEVGNWCVLTSFLTGNDKHLKRYKKQEHWVDVQLMLQLMLTLTPSSLKNQRRRSVSQISKLAVTNLISQWDWVQLDSVQCSAFFSNHFQQALYLDTSDTFKGSWKLDSQWGDFGGFFPTVCKLDSFILPLLGTAQLSICAQQLHRWKIDEACLPCACRGYTSCWELI